jgi:nucleotide sugar dehydrogenase
MSTAMTWKEADLDSPGKLGKYMVGVIGCGKTGLSTACLFANAGFRTTCADFDQYAISLIKKGKGAFAEPQLTKLLKKHVKTGHLSATNQVKEAVLKSDVIILAVAPSVDRKRKPDYSQMEKACKEIGMGLRSGSLVIVESAAGPGATETLFREAFEKTSGLKAGKDFGLAYSRPSALHFVSQDTASHPRIVGALDEQSLRAACLVLNSITKVKLIKVKNMKTADAISLFQTIHRDVYHALANELAYFCEKAGVDFLECQRAISAQISDSMPIPDVTTGYFSIEPYLLFEEAENADAELRLATQARKINEEMLGHAVHLTREALRYCGKGLKRARITVLGVSGHVNLKDMNHFFAKDLAITLSKSGAQVRVYDPFFSPKELAEMGYHAESTLGKSVEGADCLIMVVGHDRFRRLNLRRIRFLMRKPAAIIDVCNIVDADDARKQDFTYLGIGRK